MDRIKLKQNSIKLVVTIYLQIVLLVATKPILIELTNLRADFYSENLSIKHAITLYDRSLLLNSNDLHALINGGYSYEDDNNPTTAKSYYLRAIKAHPKNDAGYYYLAILESRNRNYSESKKLLYQTMKLKGPHYHNANQFYEILTTKQPTLHPTTLQSPDTFQMPSK